LTSEVIKDEENFFMTLAEINGEVKGPEDDEE
jgi:hypothetical protein